MEKALCPVSYFFQLEIVETFILSYFKRRIFLKISACSDPVEMR